MKKLIIVTTLILISGFTFGQSLQKGSILSIHKMTVTLDPDVTMNQFIHFYENKWVVEIQKHLQGVTHVLLKGDRGENPNTFAVMMIMDSKNVRDKYFPEPDKPNEAWDDIMKKVRPITLELQKLGTYSDAYTDWVVQ